MFYLGVQGPDVLFYHKPLSKNPVSAFGHELHRHSAAEFFATLWPTRENWTPATCAYLMGFCCHYTLDRACHPEVNRHSHTSIEHQRLESAFDLLIMDRFTQGVTKRGGLLPGVKDVDITALSVAYPTVTTEQLTKAVGTFHKATHLLDHRGTVQTAEVILGKRASFSTLCLPKQLPDRHTAHSLMPLFDSAIPDATAFISLLLEPTFEQSDLNMMMCENFEGVSV